MTPQVLEAPRKPLFLSECFGPTIQGEGLLIGRPTVFVRLGGCDFRCAWCDTLYAVLPEFRGDWKPTPPAQVLEQVLALTNGHPILVTLSGGNPALAPLEPLLDLGHARGCTFALETQGSVVKPWFSKLDFLTLSPKAPSSNMATDWNTVRGCLEAARGGPIETVTSLKVVVFDDVDYEFARTAHTLFLDVPFVLQPGNPEPAQPSNLWRAAPDASRTTQQVEWLIEKTTRDGWTTATILPQLHVLLWGNARGV
jgi:7-carboxy-7-deazaguanine synthase